MENQISFFKPEEIVKASSQASVGKANTKLAVMILKAVLAGAFIAFGASGSSAAIYGVSDTGIAKLLAGCIFPAGLILVVLIGAELFTGDCLMIFGCMEKKIRTFQMVKALVIVYLGNLVGSVLIAYFVCMSGQFNYGGGLLGGAVIKTAVSKVCQEPLRMVISGILCNILVCLAVLAAGAAKDVAGKILAIFFPILVFVIGGFEHCVANMYYIPAGIFAAMNDSYVESAKSVYGVTEAQISNLTAGNFALTNLLPVTIGNILGGMFFIAVPLFFIYLSNGTMREKNIH